MEVAIIGGGIIGLSLAWELGRRGVKVRVLEQGQPGREASWAGAGILPAAKALPDDPPEVHLAQLSCQLHRQWAQLLREQTGIDTGYRPCGGLYLPESPLQLSSLKHLATELGQRGMQVQWLQGTVLRECEPALATNLPWLQDAPAGLLVHEDAQLRNPWHLRALMAACLRSGAELMPGAGVWQMHRSGQSWQLLTSQGTFHAEKVCLCAGAWSPAVATWLNWHLPVEPVRGQIVLLRTPKPLLQRVVNLGPRYLVPRPDGRVLIGSTEERVGFDKRTTAQGVQGLLELAVKLVPSLAQAEVEKSWAGLRPATPDRLPVLGPVPGKPGLFVATGHFRNGVLLSPGTAVVMADVIQGRKPPVDLSPFDPARFSSGEDQTSG